MYGKVIGLDIGTFNVRALFAKITFKSISIEKKVIFRRKKDEDIDSVISRLQEVYDTKDYTPIALFPSEKLQFRTLSFPFRSEKEIRAVLKPELEAVLPKQDDDILTDFIINNNLAPQKSGPGEEEQDNLMSVISASVGKDSFSLYLEPFLEKQFIPGYIGIESVAVRALRHSYPVFKNFENKLVLDMGYKKTILTIVSQGSIQYIRVIPIGAEDFNGIIMQECSIEPERVDDVRITLGNYLWDDSGFAKNTKAEEKFLKQVGISKRSMHAVQAKGKRLLGELLREIRLSIFSHFQNTTTKFSEERINKLVILGGFSRQEGIKALISSSLNITYFDFPEIKTELSQIEGDGEESDFLICHGFLSSIAHDQAKYNINLLQDEFSSLSITKKGSSFKVPIALCLIAFFLVIGNLFFLSTLKGMEERELSAELIKRVKKYFPDVPIGNDPIRSIRGYLVNKEREGKGRASPANIKLMEILKSISQATEKIPDIKLKNIKYSARNITIKGNVSKATIAEDLKKFLEDSDIFETINDPRVKKEISKDTWSFTINARLFSKKK